MRAWLARLVDLRPGEGAPVGLMFLYLALVVAAFLLAKPVRNGLFLEAHRAEDLWVVYAIVPVTLSLVVPFYTRVVARRGHRLLIVGTLGFFALNAVLFWALFRFFRIPGLAVALYVWVNGVGAVAPVQAWAFAASLFDARQARRLLGLVGAGASVGAIGGGVLARALVGPVGAVNLLLVMAALLLLAAAVVAATWRWVPPRRPRPTEAARRLPIRRALALVARTDYLARLAALVLLATIATQWVGYQFSVAARLRYGADADRLTAWFGGFNVTAGVAALLLQMASGPLLGRVGLAATILSLPLLLGTGSIAVALTGAFWAVVATAAADQAVRFSVDKAGYELLYAPLPPAVRAPVKALLDMVGVRAAEAVGGVLLGVATGGLPLLGERALGLRGVAAMTLALVVAWAFVARGLARGYFEAIRDSVRAHRLDLERAPEAARERSGAALIAASLAAADPADVLYALSLLARERPRPHPAVRALLDHPVADVRRRALALIRASGDAAALPAVARLLRDDDLETRTEALLYLAQFAGLDPVRQIERLGAFADYSVRAAVAAFLAHPGPHQNLEAARTLIAALVAERGPEGRRPRLEAARLLAIVPDEFGDLLERLVRDEDPEVARAALRAVARHRRLAAVPLVIEQLAHEALADEAGETLVAFGPAVVDRLGRALASETTPLAARRAIPPILARLGTPQAEPYLVDALGARDTVLRSGAVRALNKLRAARPAPLADWEGETIETVLAAEIIGHYRSYQVLGRLLALESAAAVVAELRDAMDRELERIFRLLALLMPGEDLHAAYLGLRADDPTLRANAVEWLDHLLRPPALRSLLVPLLDPHVPIAERVALADRLLGGRLDSRAAALGALLASEDPWLQAAALAAIATFAMSELEGEVDRRLESPDQVVREAARAAKARLHPLGTPAAEPPSWQPPAAVGVG